MVYTVPGVYIKEGTYGAVPVGLPGHDKVYLVGHTSKVDAPKGLTYVGSADDFFNQFGTSHSTNSIKLFFNQRANSGLYFLNVAPRAERMITIPTATSGATYSLTIDGYTVSYLATASDTVASIREELGKVVNSKAIHIASYRQGFIRVNTGVTVTATANITLGDVSNNSYPVARDVADTLDMYLSPELMPGYLIAPEFYQRFTNSTERSVLASICESFVAQQDYNWVHLVDPGESTATATTASGAINLAVTERGLLDSPRGHSWYYFPYLKDLSDNLVPPSPVVAAIAIRRSRAEGVHQAPAGINYPIYGVKDTSYNVPARVQGELNPLGINCIRKLPNRGIVVYGAKSLSTNPYYRYVTVRTILNVIARAHRDAFDSLLFTTVDGSGALLATIKATSSDICERMRAQGALYGSTPGDTYLIVADSTNNLASDLENGIVYLDVVVKPSPVMEYLVVRITRASIGTVLAEILSSGDTSVPLPSGDVSTTT